VEEIPLRTPAGAVFLENESGSTLSASVCCFIDDPIKTPIRHAFTSASLLRPVLVVILTNALAIHQFKKVPAKIALRFV